ncbi:MAG TPA: DUF4058 family protein [Gemmataceae bacterium]|nr:DUF4058 family protein [Gemmataceae bacterium]
MTKQARWDSLHGGWPAMITQALNRILPRHFQAASVVRLARFGESHTVIFDDGKCKQEPSGRPTFTFATDWPDQEQYEVNVYDDELGRLVAAVEIVSPANKDRPDHRRAFVAKCATLLQNQVSVTIVDVVTTQSSNLYADLLDFIGASDPALADPPQPIYAVACRGIQRDPDTPWHLETWLNLLQVGAALPTLPLWLSDDFAVPLELEATYEETCRALRID